MNRNSSRFNSTFDFICSPKQSAFTIVELLVVIVVIGILAAITIVSYTGISSKAIVTSLQSDLDSSSRQLRMFQVEKSSFPNTISTDCVAQPDTTTNKCLKASNSTTYEYYVDNTSNKQTYCITATKNNYSYSINETGAAVPAAYCPVLYLDAGNKDSYSGTGTIWKDLSGRGNDGALNGGVSYNSGNGGVMSFDGLDDYATVPAVTNLNNTAFTIETWVNPAVLRTQGIAHKWSGSGWRLFMSSIAGTIEFDAQPGEIANIQTPALSVGEWAYIVGTYDGISTARIYKNGLLSSTANGIASMFSDSNFGVEVSSAEGSRWNGKISEVNVYSRALFSGEITQNFNATKARYGL